MKRSKKNRMCCIGICVHDNSMSSTEKEYLKGNEK
jgi:hypothetical protein